jgi:hypothetical protein
MPEEPIMNTENTNKILEVDNINDCNSKIRGQNVIIKSKQIHPIDLKHVPNWSNLKDQAPILDQSVDQNQPIIRLKPSWPTSRLVDQDFRIPICQSFKNLQILKNSKMFLTNL